MKNEHWILCPTCGSKTRDKIREDTVLKNFPLYCPKCKQESLIEVENLNIVVIKEPDAPTDLFIKIIILPDISTTNGYGLKHLRLK